MKFLKWTTALLLAGFVMAALALHFTGHSYFWTALRHTYLQGHSTAHIDDASNFAQATIAAGRPQPPVPDPRLGKTVLPADTLAMMQANQTAAFLVLHQGRLLHESYLAPYNAQSRTNSFSMAKTVVTMLTGAAVADGIVDGFDAPVSRYLTEYATHPQGAKATLAQLAAMTSGHQWTENYYPPLNPTTELYFGGDAPATVLRQGFEREPGAAFEYSSASTQLLALALSRALKRKDPTLTLASYLSNRLWQPLGMEGDASWSLDRPRENGGNELAYCCIHSSARNFARLGQLLLQKGQWNGQQLLPANFVQRMTTPNGLVPYYGHGLWMDPSYGTPFYSFQGHLGQYVIVAPEAELVVVRLGLARQNARDRHPVLRNEVYEYLDAGLRLARDTSE